MKNLYDLKKAASNAVAKYLSPILKSPGLQGKKAALATISEDFKAIPGKPTVWFNATSIGDFGIVRPVIERLKDECNIVITFHKTEGYEALTQPEAKYHNIFYLPVDSEQNAAKFLDVVKPAAAVFVESDVPHNYLNELKGRHIPAFLVSAKVRDDILQGKLGGLFKKNLANFEKIFTAEDVSADKLRDMGLTEVETSGDPLFDNAMTVAMEPYTNEVVERFKGNKPLFIAGSIHLDDDMDLIERLVKEFTDIKFLIVPHDISSKKVSEIKKRLGLNIPYYTEVADGALLPPTNSLIIDSKGDLAKLYRYADFAFVGGGFAKSLHSVIEPVVYGLPISFGPHIKHSTTAQIMEEKGIGERFTTYPQFRIWLSTLINDFKKREEVKLKAQQLFEKNTGAADLIAKDILKAAKKGA